MISLVLVLVVVVNATRPHLITGAGQAAPIPDPPAVGDCVLDPVADKSPMGTTITASSGGTVPVYTAQQTKRCTGARYGEVTAVISTPKPAVVRGDDTTGRYLDDPNYDACLVTSIQYQGITIQPIQRFWQAHLQTSFTLSAPSPRQKAAGQHWAACIVAVRSPGSVLKPTSQISFAPRYDGSLRNALQTGQQLDRLGNCMPTVDWDGQIMVDGCSQPHALEILAYGNSGDGPVSRTQLELTCRQAIRHLTAMPDPTAAGALRIQLHVEDNASASIISPQVPAHSNLECGITTADTRKLHGSLIALRQRRIPWA